MDIIVQLHWNLNIGNWISDISRTDLEMQKISPSLKYEKVKIEYLTPLASHKNHQGEGIANMNRPSHSCSGSTITVSYFHMTFRRCQRKVNRIRRIYSGKIEFGGRYFRYKLFSGQMHVTKKGRYSVCLCY